MNYENEVTPESGAVDQVQETIENLSPDMNVIELKLTNFEDRLVKLEEELLLLVHGKTKKTKVKKEIKPVEKNQTVEKTEDELEIKEEIKEKVKVNKKDKSKKKEKKK